MGLVLVSFFDNLMWVFLIHCVNLDSYKVGCVCYLYCVFCVHLQLCLFWLMYATLLLSRLGFAAVFFFFFGYYLFLQIVDGLGCFIQIWPHWFSLHPPLCGFHNFLMIFFLGLWVLMQPFLLDLIKWTEQGNWCRYDCSISFFLVLKSGLIGFHFFFFLIITFISSIWFLWV